MIPLQQQLEQQLVCRAKAESFILFHDGQPKYLPSYDRKVTGAIVPKYKRGNPVDVCVSLY